MHAIDELSNKLLVAMEGYDPETRFTALSKVVAAGIVAHTNTQEREASVFGAFLLDVISHVWNARQVGQMVQVEEVKQENEDEQ